MYIAFTHIAESVIYWFMGGAESSVPILAEGTSFDFVASASFPFSRFA